MTCDYIPNATPCTHPTAATQVCTGCGTQYVACALHQSWTPFYCACPSGSPGWNTFPQVNPFWFLPKPPPTAPPPFHFFSPPPPPTFSLLVPQQQTGPSLGTSTSTSILGKRSPSTNPGLPGNTTTPVVGGPTKKKKTMRTQDELRDEAKKRTEKSGRGFSKKGAEDEFKALTERTDTFTGAWKPDVTISGFKSFATRRREQLLRHISTQFFWYIRKLEPFMTHKPEGWKSEQEVQAMAVNDRIIVAANNDVSLGALAAKLTEQVQAYETALKNPLSTPPEHPLQQLLSQAQYADPRTLVYASKLSKVFDGSRLSDGEALSLRRMVQTTDFFAELNASDKAACTKAVTDDGNKHKLVFVTTGGETLHAEQKLLMVLQLSGSKAPAEIYGKKRPCAGCELTLRFAEEKLGLAITYNPNPGGYWDTAIEGLVRLVRESGITNKVALLKWVHDYANSYVNHQTHDHPSKPTLRNTVVTTQDTFANVGTSFITEYDSGSDSEAD